MNGGRGRSSEGETPLGAGSPDEPAHTLPAEPAQITKVPAPKAAGEPSSRSGQRQEKRPGNEEPEPTLEEDLPSDGRDEKGEAMIRDLPRNAGKKEK